MRVLNIVLENTIGGPQIRVLNVAKTLRDQNIDTLLLCPNSHGKFEKMARAENFLIYPIYMINPKNMWNFWSIIHNILWMLSLPASIYLIIRIIKKEKIDIVHVNGLFCIQGAIAAFILRKKIIWHLIGSLYPNYALKILIPGVILVSDKIIVISKRLKDYYFKYYLNKDLSKIVIIHEGIDANKFNSTRFSDDYILKTKYKYHLDPAKIIIGSVGNINPIKGFEYLIEGISQVIKQFNNCIVLIVGEVPNNQNIYFLNLIRLIKKYNLENRLVFVGSKTDIPNFLSIIDIFVLPSRSEGTPIAILEAMSMQKPIIATNVGGIPDQIRNGIDGYIIPKENSQKIAEALLTLIKNEKLRNFMGMNGRTQVLEQFTIEKCSNDHQAIYNQILRGEKQWI
jgi:glycosyltransferase involved in cell wall biosynthesis